MNDEIESVEYIGDDETYMYDVGMYDTPHTFFANDILVHNSVYLSNQPLISVMKIEDDEKCKQLTIKTNEYLVDVMNKYYDELMVDMFNCKSHEIKISGETIGRRAIWIAKKRYAIHKVYDLEKHKDVHKFHIKGLDVVRSSFPSKFKNFMLNEDEMTGIIADFLFDVDKSVVDEKILTFKREVGSYPVEEIAKNTSIKELSKYEKYCGGLAMGQFPKKVIHNGNPLPYTAHAKASLNFNSFLKHHNLQEKCENIFDGEKIKYVYLKPNEYALEEIAFRGYHDPEILMDFIIKYADGQGLYEKELANKLDDFYHALNWDYPSESDKVLDAFFGGADENVTIQSAKKIKKKVEVKKSEKAESFFEF